MRHVLFISHDASRTGAPVLLLHFLHWFKKNTSCPFLIVLRQDGALREEFEKLAPVIIYKPQVKFKATPFNKIKSHLLHRFKRIQNFQSELAGYNIGLIFSNTLTNGVILQNLQHLKVPVISYVHELKYTLSVEYAGPLLDYSIKHTSFFLSGSEAVKQNLVKEYSLLPEKIKVVYSFLPSQHFSVVATDASHLKQSLGIEPNRYVIGGIGAGAWRKGVDLFLLLAAKLIREKAEANYHFVWIGIGAYPHESAMLSYDVEKAGLSEFVHLLPSTGNYKEYLQVFDIFVLPSREDPYPLIVLEAAMMEKPLICFEGAGGVPEFIQGDAGKVIPYLNLDQMAEAVEEIRHNPEATQRMTAIAKERVTLMHDVEITAPIIRDIIEKYAGS